MNTLNRMFWKGLILLQMLFFSGQIISQEIYFFTEGTDVTFYDQGIVNVNDLGGSAFEYTHPPGLPQYYDKVPCSTISYEGESSLKFNYTSSSTGNWKVNIYRNDWSAIDLTIIDSIEFYVYSENELPTSALPLIGVNANNISGSGEIESTVYSAAAYNTTVPAGEWVKIKFPIDVITEDAANSELNFASVRSIIFNQSELDNSSRVIFIDKLVAFKSLDVVPSVTEFTATGYDSNTELNWDFPLEYLSYRIYASFDGGESYEIRDETKDSVYLDFVPEEAKNSTVHYRITAFVQEKESEPVENTAEIKDFTNEELLDMFQHYSFRYFWEGAHQATGMAMERISGDGTTVASGATGMGLMAMIIAYEREYQPREEIKDRVLKIFEFLENCSRYHGAWSHWYNAETYHTKPFTTPDDGGDLVETSYVAAGLIALRNYFSGSDTKSTQIREKASQLWEGIDWGWYRQGQNVLYWHWSPNYGFQMNMKIKGWNECMITYIMAASSPTHNVQKEVYDQGWASSGGIASKRTFYNYEINLSPDWGGPLFWLHYSFLGINPHELEDQYADYWQELVNTAMIHHAYAIDNPLGHTNYSDKCWGLTSSDDPTGYVAHRPHGVDNGTISPTAALASMPYTPEESMKALKYFYRERGSDLFGIYGPYDAFNDNHNWVKKGYIGIDQGPIVVMIENYRTELLWQNVMKDADIQTGLDKLGIQYPLTYNESAQVGSSDFGIYPNPSNGKITLELPYLAINKLCLFKLYHIDGQQVMSKNISNLGSRLSFNLAELPNGTYIAYIINGDIQYKTKLILQK